MIRPLVSVIALACAVAALLPAYVLAHRPSQVPALTPPPPVAGSSVAEDGFSSGRSARVTAAAPTDAPAPAPTAPPIRDIIASAFAPLGPGAVAWGERIAGCESSYNPSAVNPASNAMGLFQFLPSTWAGTPFAAASPFDPIANANAAAWLFRTYGPNQWECRA